MVVITDGLGSSVKFQLNFDTICELHPSLELIWSGSEISKFQNELELFPFVRL